MSIIHIFFIIFLYIGILKANKYSDDTDPKEAFFRYLQTKHIEANNFENIPQPGGFQHQQRKKRLYHVLPSLGLISHFFINKKIPYNRIKRQTNHSNILQGKNRDLIDNHYISVTKDFTINNLMRFKQNFRNKREPDESTKKLMIDKDLNEGSERETRGVTKEQWIKQQYPVDRPLINDNIPSASANTNSNANADDNIRAPRVHFVTTQRQRRPELPALPSFREREGRSRERDVPPYPIYQQQHPYFVPYPQSHLYYPQTPRARTYEASYRAPRYYDPYFQHFDDRDRERSYGYSMEPFPFDDGRHNQQQNKQRRIIYYATLPEVVRSPVSSASEQRHNANWKDQDIYEKRYYGSQIQSQKHREHNASTVSTFIQDQGKTPLFPIKVSTDVNVRELNKNPERRFFSEEDSRFTYKLPENANF